MKSCLDSNGRYVLVCFGCAPTEQQIVESRKHFNDFFAACGYPNANVEVWGQDLLLGLFAPYPSLCLQIAGLKDLEFQDFRSWRLMDGMRKDQSLHLGPPQEEFIANIRSDIRGSVIRHVRVTGEPGLGKSRLILEALSADDLAPNVLYVPRGEAFQTSQLFNQILRSDNAYRIILVIDDCPRDERASIWDALKNRSDRVKLVTIYHEPDDVSGESIQVRNCPSLSQDKITAIIREYVPSKLDAERWSAFCDGSPRVAHAVGQNLKSNPDDILKTPASVPIWDRFVAGFGKAGSAALTQTQTVLRHVALFRKFGFEEPLESEAQYIARLARQTDPSLTWARFQEIVADLKSRRILQGSRTLFIVPKALHVYLWLQFWEKSGRGFSVHETLAAMPESLRRWFSEMFLYGHASDQAKLQVKKLLSPQGPFDDQFVQTQFGCAFLNTLAEADPEATLACIDRTIGAWSNEQLIAFREGRQYVLWALEKIATWKATFVKAAKLLLKLAVAENASNGNNATGMFIQLFTLGTGPFASTEASPDERMPVLLDALESSDHNTRQIAIRACGAALSTEPSVKSIGPEYQGLRPTANLWSPRTWGEVYDAYRKLWAMTVKAHQAASGNERSEIAKVLIDSANALVLNPYLAQLVMKTLRELSQDAETPTDVLVSFISLQLRRDHGHLKPATIRQIRQLDKRITGTSFASRFRRIVMVSSWDEDYDASQQKRTDQMHVKIQLLAAEALANFKLLQPLLPELTVTAGRRLYDFGFWLGKGDGKNDMLDEIVKAHGIAAGGRNVQLLAGYLRALFDRDNATWQTLILKLMDDRSFDDVIGAIIWSSGVTDAVVMKLAGQTSAGHRTARDLTNCAYAPQLKMLKEATIVALIECAIGLKSEGLHIAFEITDTFYCRDENPLPLPKELAFRTLCAGPFGSRGRDTMGEYHWQNIAERYLKAYPDTGIELLKAILAKFEEWRFALDLSFSHANMVLRQIIQNAPYEAWSVVASALDDVDSRIAHAISVWLKEKSFNLGTAGGVISLFPVDAILDWVAVNPSERSRFIARILPQSLANDALGNLTREFMIRFGDREGVGSDLMLHFWSGGFSGPASKHYRGKRDEARQWLTKEKSCVVSDWLERYIEGLGKDIERAEIEEERRF